jgi:hypothetical protein
MSVAAVTPRACRPGLSPVPRRHAAAALRGCALFPEPHRGLFSRLPNRHRRPEASALPPGLFPAPHHGSPPARAPLPPAPRRGFPRVRAPLPPGPAHRLPPPGAVPEAPSAGKTSAPSPALFRWIEGPSRAN